MDNQGIRDKTELEFQNWLEKNKIPYFYINQEVETFSSLFEDKLKRPDFAILLENFGCILVDIKNKKIQKEFGTYCIDKAEIQKYSSFQRKFNLQIWFALSNEDLGYKTWLWIPVSKVLELNLKPCESNKSNEEFFPIPAEEFIQISSNYSIDRLFSKRM